MTGVDSTVKNGVDGGKNMCLPMLKGTNTSHLLKVTVINTTSKGDCTNINTMANGISSIAKNGGVMYKSSDSIAKDREEVVMNGEVTKDGRGNSLHSSFVLGHYAMSKTQSQKAIEDMTMSKNWYPHICDDKWAEMRSDGKSILCLACVGKNSSRTDGVVKSRYDFAPSNWDDHKTGKDHIVNVAMKEAVTEDDGSKLKPKFESTHMPSYFTANKKKGDSKATNSSAVAVDLTSAKQPK